MTSLTVCPPLTGGARIRIAALLLSVALPPVVVGQAPSAPTAAAHPDRCGFGRRARDLCAADGRVLVCVVDSTHVIVAVARRDSGSFREDTVEHLFLYTAAGPVSSLASRTINAGHVEYREGELYLSGGDARTPSVVFVATDAPFLAPRHASAIQLAQSVGLSHQLASGLTLDAIARLRPRESCDDAPDPKAVRGACFEVDGRTIRFPH